MDHPWTTFAAGAIKVAVRRDPAAADLPFPKYMTEGAAGADLYAAVVEPLIVKMGDVVRIPTGVSFEIPRGYEGQIRARSGLAFEKGFALVNAPGTIDSDYRGEIQVIATCLSSTPLVVRRGTRIAQIVFAPVARAEFSIVEALAPSKRGEAGFGSTGVGAPVAEGAAT
jgi:dUTP pyrophosphatase